MSESPVYKFEVQITNSEGITTDSIVRAPRVYKPQDLQTACHNTSIVTKGEACPSVVAVVNFVLTEFFVLAHRTGLYNRQRNLWEALSKVSLATVFQLRQGMLKRQPLPLYDIHFQDHRLRTFIFAHVIDPSFREEKPAAEKVLTNFLKRAQKLTGLNGLFLCCPKPFPAAVVERVTKLTGGSDPVGRYESILPEPWAAPLDLLEIGSIIGGDGSADDKLAIRLIHPDLTSAKRIRAASVQADL
jgi:hypothetical protein